MFSDVDTANTTSIQFFDSANASLGTFFVPAVAGSETFAFLGVTFPSAVVARVRIISGNAALAAGATDQNGDLRDVVAMDDFIYGEPVLAPVADLAIAKTHAGNFTQGQVGATYTMTVTNAGTGATSGAVTVTDTAPSGLAPTAASGTGWTCAIAAQVVTCTRSDVLASTASYPAITVTVAVGADAAPSLTNVATVAGGGDANPANNSAADPTIVVAVLSAPASIPALDASSLLLLSALLALFGIRARRRSATISTRIAGPASRRRLVM